ncbi:MAG: hypothetical protein MUF18_03500 [Fimbriiglobus sp.]|nr:hypothetical protein [Fimbriiglobus sp.]
MSAKMCCPACDHPGTLPPGVPADALLTCPTCGVRFPATPIVPPDVPPLGVWVGDGHSDPPVPDLPLPVVTPENAAAYLAWVRAEVERFDVYVARQLALFQKMREQIAAFESRTRTEAVRKEQALDRDRAVLDARAKELDAQEAKISAALKLEAAGLQEELGRQVAAEREQLARRAETLARGERALERRTREVEELEERLRAETRQVERRTREAEETGRVAITPVPPAYDMLPRR